jgi:hypothetical protein
MRAPVFDDLLDEHLAWAPPAARRSTAGPAGTAATYGFFFDAAPATVAVPAINRERITFRGEFRIEVIADVCTVVQRPAQPTYGPAAESGSRIPRPATRTPVDLDSSEAPRRILSALERAALAEMNALGASLAANFTSGDLRRAFRMLALQYHPDRHPSQSAGARAHLSERFTRAREAYQMLRRV